jgi:hypothetical protein
MPAFDCFVGIDWSGDKNPWQKGLKVAIAYPGCAAPVLKECPIRKGGWSRTDVVEWMADQFQDQRALIGIDFAFGFPEVTLPGNIVLDWEYAEEVCATQPNFYGGAFFRPPVRPHSHLVNSRWLPKDRYSANHLRNDRHRRHGNDRRQAAIDFQRGRSSAGRPVIDFRNARVAGSSSDLREQDCHLALRRH